MVKHRNIFVFKPKRNKHKIGSATAAHDFSLKSQALHLTVENSNGGWVWEDETCCCVHGLRYQRRCLPNCCKSSFSSIHLSTCFRLGPGKCKKFNVAKWFDSFLVEFLILRFVLLCFTLQAIAVAFACDQRQYDVVLITHSAHEVCFNLLSRLWVVCWLMLDFKNSK